MLLMQNTFHPSIRSGHLPYHSIRADTKCVLLASHSRSSQASRCQSVWLVLQIPHFLGMDHPDNTIPTLCCSPMHTQGTRRNSARSRFMSQSCPRFKHLTGGLIQRSLSMQTAKFWRSFTRFIDDFSCMAFTVSILITVQFWILHLVTGGLVERSQDRPPWLGFSVHVLNACMSVADVLLSNPRSFSPRAHTMLLGYTTLYAAFLAVCRHDLSSPIIEVFILSITEFQL